MRPIDEKEIIKRLVERIDQIIEKSENKRGNE